MALLCGDSDAFVLAYMGILRAGAVVVPINTRLATAAAEVGYILNHADASVMLVEDKFVPVWEQARSSTQLRCTVPIGESRPPGTLTWEDLLGSPTTEVEVQVEGRDQALPLYTSGTTGRPKGAMLLVHRHGERYP